MKNEMGEKNTYIINKKVFQNNFKPCYKWPSCAVAGPYCYY